MIIDMIGIANILGIILYALGLAVLVKISTILWRCDSDGINLVIARHPLGSYAGTIHVGSCRGTGYVPDGIEAHTHRDGTPDICVFRMDLAPQILETLLAHEYAHVLTTLTPGEDHGDAWSRAISCLGYPDEALRFEHGEVPNKPHGIGKPGDPVIRDFAIRLHAEIEAARPTYCEWLVTKIKCGMAALTA